ncbi:MULTISPECIES: trypsin-like peptidase domain-containing protein [unclassified Methylobacterium]|uniref:trypsin-like peptidase domain-containing protein n=1 Tax=unclassified Methylobacterium TaxID=2615210 RepID=UPI0036F57794
MSNTIDVKNIDLISFASCPVEMLFRNQIIAHGTGFVWRYNSKPFFITNWHNLTGKNPLTGDFLSVGGAVPDTIRIHLAKRVPGSTNICRKRSTVDIQLYENYCDPFWFQHKNFNELKIDISAIKLDESVVVGAVCLNEFGYEHLFNHVGTDVFIVGYPNKDYENDMPPIWKRGALASEPLLEWHGKPAFLIDAASRSGMSGSPIFRRVFGPATIVESDNTLTTNLKSVMTTDFIGIYSGHLSDMGEQLTIGIGWSRNLMLDIMQNPAQGTRD